MNGDGLVLLAVWSFWIFITIAAIRARRSWFPFTLVAPIVFSLFGIIINRLLPPWGLILIGGAHVIPWLLLFYIWLKERLAGHDRIDNGPRGQ